MTAVVLAGGKGKRFGGKEKPLLKVGPLPILDHILAKLSPLFEEIIVVANSLRLYAKRGVKMVPDEVLGQGPLRGILSGLKASSSLHNFVVAGDMPFLNLELIKFLKREAKGFDVVIPHSSRGLEPLHALYSLNCIPFIEESIKKDFQVISFLPQVKVKYIPEEKVKTFDPHSLSFFNVNTTQDLETAQKIYQNLKEGKIEEISHRQI